MAHFPFSGSPILTSIFWVACAAWIVPEIAAWRMKRSSDTSLASDRGSLQLIVVLWWLGIALAVAIAILVPQAALTSHRAAIFCGGICIMLAGVVLRWYSAALLGKYFTFDVAVAGGHSLIEAGPYRYIRHPSYSGALLSLLGFGLALGNWAALAVAMACLASAYLYRIPVEERALQSALGEPYQQYMQRTWRLVPFIF